MNFSTHAFADGKRQRIELEVGVAKAAVAYHGARRLYDQNRTEQVDDKQQEHPRVSVALELLNHAEEKWQSNHLSEDGAHPNGDGAFLFLTFRAARKPIGF